MTLKEKGKRLLINGKVDSLVEDCIEEFLANVDAK